MHRSTLDLENIIISAETTIHEALARLERSGTGALAICDDRRRLLGLLTDGDIRRALMKSVPLSSACSAVAGSTPITIAQPVVPGEALLLMNKHDINHLPVLDTEGRLQDLLRRNDLIAESDLDIHTISRLELTTIAPELPLDEVLPRLELAGTGGLMLCDEHGHLQGLITDGDLRRAVLKGVSLQAACSSIASREPVTAPATISAGDALHLMNEHDINHLPLVGTDGKVIDFLLRKDLVSEQALHLSAVIMAGGYGQRLLPLTEQVPKPMLPVGDRPLLERTIQQLRKAGITEVHLATHHLSDQITTHFGNGEAFGVHLNYAQEDQPLGTAGGLKLVPDRQETCLVLNGDILTGLSYREMLDFHRHHRADMTIGVRKYEITVPFGVVECDDFQVRQLHEKPTQALFINAGVYLLEPRAIEYIPDGVRFDMTDLIQVLLQARRNVVSFPILEYWLDIGRPDDYQKAQDDLRQGQF